MSIVRSQEHGSDVMGRNMTKNCSQCKYWIGQAFDAKGTWRKCENPKAKQYRMYMERNNRICKIGDANIEAKKGEGNMIQESITEVVSKRKVHQYICDQCGRTIGKATEYEDGYIPTPDGVNTIDASFCFDNTWYEFNKKIYCNDCIETAKKDFINKIEEIGFVIQDD